MAALGRPSRPKVSGEEVASLVLELLGGLAVIAAGAALTWWAMRSLLRYAPGAGQRLGQMGSLLLGLWLSVDTALWLSGNVTMYNAVTRVVAGAPAVHVGGRALWFERAERPWNLHMMSEQGRSDEGLPWRRFPGASWLIVTTQDGRSLRYSFPRALPYQRPA